MWRILRWCLSPNRSAARQVGPGSAAGLGDSERQDVAEPTRTIYLTIPRRAEGSRSIDLAKGKRKSKSAAGLAAAVVSEAGAPAGRCPVTRNAAKRLSSRQVAKKRRRRCCRFAARFSDMEPGEARILMAIHRRSPKRLALESPGMLKRDWQRFLLSSRGQRIAPRGAVPELDRVRSWIRQARERSAGSAPARVDSPPPITAH
ncbi:MAG: DUF4332 domain-containing protein [Planctomycetaceae bacterium]|nr:MAG: DUF4332 domain-containing protein [Planctomycetaceae bacterium]